ncbi:phosphoglycolate phosphatase, clustered with ribosomal large subunit pseudouridine synthase C [Enhygromyxa salina]|uniref:phosphoglycolate phosphatase n=1 Tax=Enhygromyxa salina TaxID=215803 RepID=A0A0C2CW34_9BACT|nr:HAD family hydrolase [Enhygromyxa salina]KIG12082.1 phosphoglycolate phosphatase, clustered with ribosomal large subunit pseudouridine synthase C [Enhygromyxa salina]
MRYPVLIFDLDDTLIESFPEYVRLHQRIASDLGWQIPTAEQLVHYGPTWEATLERLWPGVGLEPFMARYEQLADDHSYPAIVGVPAALTRLREAGHSLWIVTKRSRRRLSQRMGQAGLPQEWFAGIFAYEDQPVSKPDPRCFEPVWQALGGSRSSAAERALYVGDRKDDQLAADAAGVGFVGVRTGPEHLAQASFLDRLPHEHVLDSAAELPGWLEARR